MNQTHNKNTVRYYLVLALALVFLFFSNDFGWLDVQKTAIVMAVGIDREEDTYVLTSQIAIPQSSKQGKSTETVQLVSKGKTIAKAFSEINEKTGWYPKLVFCHLILLGEKTTEENVFDVLDFFLRDEYLTDNCLLATCNGLAKDLLNESALVDPSISIAVEKVLSSHAERVGTVLPSTLRQFSIGYFSDSQSGFLPLLKKQPQQEPTQPLPSENSQGTPDSSSQGSQNSNGGNGGNGGQGGNGGESSGGENSSGGGEQKSASEKPVFSATETALFVKGKRVGLFSDVETFAYGAVMNKLRLANYSVSKDEAVCTFTIKHNASKLKISIDENNRAVLKISLKMSAGVLDYSKAQSITEISDVGDVPAGYFERAEKELAEDIEKTFEKCRACNCDLFGIRERLRKYQKKHFDEWKTVALSSSLVDVKVQFENIR